MELKKQLLLVIYLLSLRCDVVNNSEYLICGFERIRMDYNPQQNVCYSLFMLSQIQRRNLDYFHFLRNVQEMYRVRR